MSLISKLKIIINNYSNKKMRSLPQIVNKNKNYLNSKIKLYFIITSDDINEKENLHIFNL